MKAEVHAISGGAVAMALIPVLGIDSVFFWASSFLIDGDHYLDYICRNRFKDLSIKNMFDFHKRLQRFCHKPGFVSFNLMHTIEAQALIGSVVLLTNWVWLKAVLFGMLFHMLLDLIYLIHGRRLFQRALSIIEYVVRLRNYKRKGIDPDAPYNEVLDEMFNLSEKSPT